MKPNSFSFNLIIRDNSDCIIECLDSTLPAGAFGYVFCDTGSKDNTVELVTKWCADNGKECTVVSFKDTYGYDWDDTNFAKYDFGSARQLALNETKTPFMIWLDSDDVLENAAILPQIVDNMIREDLGQVLLPYRYGVDRHGNDIVYHYRERVIRNSPGLKWKGAVHEVLEFPEMPKTTAMDNVKWRHKRKPQHVKRTGRRNHLIMLNEYATLDKQKMNKPLRLLQNFAYDHFEHREWDSACKYYSEFYSTYLERSASSRERKEHEGSLGYSVLNWARCEMARGNFEKAEELINKVKHEDETDKQLYVLLAQIRLQQGKYDSAEMYLSIARNTAIKPSLLPINHVGIALDEVMLSVEVCKAKGEFERALAELDRASRITPDDPRIRNAGMELNALISQREGFNGFLNIKTQLLDDGNLQGLNALTQAVPSILSLQEGIKMAVEDIKGYVSETVTLRSQPMPENKYIVIFTGPAFEKWAGDSRKNGIGGSEEMVIGIANHLSKLGNKVKVVNDCQDLAGDYDGVEYVDFREYKPDSPDVLIVSRIPQMFYYQTNHGMMPKRLFGAKRQYLWLHDTSYGNVMPMGPNNADGVFVLTQFHKDIIKASHNVNDAKMWITRNGIEAEHYEKLLKEKKVKRNPKKLIYCSSYDRGLLEFLQIYKKIKAEVPDVEAKIFYGWNTYDARMKQMPEDFCDHPSGLSMREYKDAVVKLMEEVGLEDGGRIGQDELFLEMASSNIWLYPTWFSEISCYSGDTRVLTSEGEKRIDSLVLEDKVFTHEGRLQPINNLQRKSYNGNLINLKVQNGDKIRSTPEHPYLVCRMPKLSARSFNKSIESGVMWKKAADLIVGDLLVMPRLDMGDGLRTLDLTYNGRVNNFNTDAGLLEGVDNLEIDSELAQWIGYFLGDGSASLRTGKVNVLVADKRSEHKWYGEYMARFGKLHTRKLRGCTEYFVHSYKLARALRRYFYKNGLKNITSDVYSNQNCSNILEGLLDADGHLNRRKDTHSVNRSFTNKSLSLIGFVRMVLSRDGTVAPVNQRAHKNGSVSYSMTWSEDTKVGFYGVDSRYIYMRVKSISEEQYQGNVYNMEVDLDNSYIVNGFAVHNCITAMRAQLAGSIPVVTPVAALNETVKIGFKDADMDKLANKCIELIRDPKKAEEIRKEAIEAGKQFSLEGLAIEWNKFMGTVL